MTGVDDSVTTASPRSVALHSSASKEESLAFYKAQYEQLEAELADFQASSRELETELERDVEEAEKRERTLREKNEALQFEVDEWKSKCKQAKSEANTAQNTLQKEITALRETNRTLQLKLRDTEVQNDDFERQARNTTSSLEDLESKYTVAVERAVILEGEIKSGEQEREELRIETQRLRDELSDLKVEAEIRQDKLRHAEAASRLRKPAPLASALVRPSSAHSDHSPVEDDTTATSSVATPPTKSVSSVTSDNLTPPSPPTSDRSQPRSTVTPAQPIKSRLSITNSTTPRPLAYSARPSRPSRGGAGMSVSGIATPAGRRVSQPTRTEAPPVPSSSSLTQIRGLIGKMQRLEQRVQSARSKLPAPTTTPPRGSPRPGSALSQTSSNIPASVTVRSARKRTSVATSTRESSAAPSVAGADTPSSSQRPNSRLSYGVPPPAPSAAHSRENQAAAHSVARPGSRQSLSGRDGFVRPGSRQSLSTRQSMSHLTGTVSDSLHTGIARPASRQSLSTRQSMSHLTSGRISAAGHAATTGGTSSRPTSRASNAGGARTPLGNYADTSSAAPPRPRSSIGSAYGSTTSSSIGGGGAPSFSASVHGSQPSYGGSSHSSSGHGSSVYGSAHSHQPSFSASVHGRRSGMGWSSEVAEAPGGQESAVGTPTPSRRTTFGKEGVSGIPAPAGTAAATGGSGSSGTGGKRPSAVADRRGSLARPGEMGPPERRAKAGQSVGETF